MGTLRATAGGQSATVRVNRPRFNDVWNAYPVGMSAPDAYKMVGGNVYEHYLEKPDRYANACALRLSRAFNYGGLTIQRGPGAYKLRGGDGKAYIMRVSDMLPFVKQQFGTPDLTIRGSAQSQMAQLAGKKGIVNFAVSGWNDATGHVTLWNGRDCGDHCYFVHDQPGVTTTEVLYWELK
ncbi:type VI secretion system amidase effector protein Tae4 [Chitiniphilus shinanonensis]|uniref:type VI secretion system amidase effector protein Tae4 n=1 Tax=Chitiniphilus shinanonensis TaxID=553088 RepID=UPI00306F5F6E